MPPTIFAECLWRMAGGFSAEALLCPAGGAITAAGRGKGWAGASPSAGDEAAGVDCCAWAVSVQKTPTVTQATIDVSRIGLLR